MPVTQPSTAPRVVLHIGAMKTGTSTLQDVLTRHAPALAEQGVLFPSDPDWSVQVRAVRDALDLRVRKQRPGRWAEMARRLRTHDGHLAVLSMEFLSFADLEHARRVVDSLAPAEVHAVLTLRDPSRVLPSAWQEWTQNRGTASWTDYLATAERLAPGSSDTADTSPAARAYRRVLDTDRMLSVWPRVVAAGRLHVVTVPPPDAPARLLWDRFATVLDIDAAAYDLPPKGANESIDYHAAELMWRVNRQVDDLNFAAYDDVVKKQLCKQVLAPRPDPTPVPLPQTARELAVRWARHTVHLVEEAGANVVGDLSELEPVASRFAPGPLPDIDRQAIVAVAHDALAGLGADPASLPDADVDAAVAAVAARIHVLADKPPAPVDEPPAPMDEQPPPVDEPPAPVEPVRTEKRGLLRFWRGGRRPS